MSGTSPQTGTTPSSGTHSGPLSGGAIPPASDTPSLTTTTLPTDRLDAIDQALSKLRASQADHNKLWVKQASGASSLSDHINHLDLKLETFADTKDRRMTLGSGSSSSSTSEEEEEKEKEKRKTLNLTARRQDFRQCTAKNLGDSLGDVQLMQSLLTAETLPTFHGKPNEDPNIFLTSFDRYATAAGWSHQDYILHFEGQLRDNADIVCCFLEQERTKGGILLTPMEAKTQLLNCFQHHDRVTAKIMTLGNLRMNVDESVDA
ncbi:hypothetical protein QOT17_020383 [Balamuthia mandrillaris]